MSENGHPNKEQSPLGGVVLCCTSISPEQRGEMASIAQQMGAVFKLDLTSDVTHLMVGNIDTPKYKYVARERQDIKVVSPEWLDAVRKSWLEGGDTNVIALENQYALPTFAGLQICVTGFDDLQQRNEISETIGVNGAKYHGDLTKMVTHLVAAAPQGKKYDYARHWKIKIVSVEWLRDSMQRGMALDESLYHPQLPVEQRGRGAVIRKNQPSPSLGKRVREDDQQAEPLETSRRKLRRVASQKLESQNDELWADIGSGHTGTGQDMTAEWDERLPHVGKDADATSTLQDPSTKPRDIPHAPDQPASAGDTENKKLRFTDKSQSGVFSADEGDGERMYIHGFDERKTPILYNYLAMNGARLLSYEEMQERFHGANLSGDTSTRLPVDLSILVTIIVPHNYSDDNLSSLKSQNFVAGNDRYVTDWWVERCLHYKTLMDKNFVLSRPLSSRIVEGFERLTICPTSFSGIDLLHLSKVVKLIGAKYDECLRPSTSVLVCNVVSPNPEKLEYAWDHNIEVVTADWLWRSIERCRVQPFEAFRLSKRKHKLQKEQGSSHESSKIGVQAGQSAVRNDGLQDRPDRIDSLRRGRLELHPTPQIGSPPINANECMPNNAEQSSKPIARETIQPLQELPPDMNSPQKPRQSPSKLVAPPSPEKSNQTIQTNTEANLISNPLDASDPSAYPISTLPDHPAPTTAPLSPTNTTLNNAIAFLLAQKKAAAAAAISTTPPIPAPHAAPAPRRHRPLGRAPSNTSSLGVSNLSGNNSVDAGPPITEDEEDELMDRKRKAVEAFSFRPSQALTYEDPEAMAAREKLRRRMGLGVDAVLDGARGMTRVESIGVVRDAVDGSGEERARRRTARRK